MQHEFGVLTRGHMRSVERERGGGDGSGWEQAARVEVDRRSRDVFVRVRNVFCFRNQSPVWPYGCGHVGEALLDMGSLTALQTNDPDLPPNLKSSLYQSLSVELFRGLRNHSCLLHL